MRPWVISSIGAAIGVALLATGTVVMGEMRENRATIQRLTAQEAARTAAEAKASADAKASQDAAALASARSDAEHAKTEAAQAKADAAKAVAQASQAQASAASAARKASALSAEKSTTKQCGTVGGFAVSANSATSCPFAVTVARGYLEYGASFSARSAVTGQWYDMACTPYPVTCTGGNGAAVYLR